jgi:hypothetical protein
MSADGNLPVRVFVSMTYVVGLVKMVVRVVRLLKLCSVRKALA